jgi:hypothetical protein
MFLRATTPTASGSRATDVEVVGWELDLRQDGDESDAERQRVHPPREGQCAERQHPRHELGREDLAEQREAGARGEARENELSSPGVPAAGSHSDAQECYECDKDGQEE